MIRPLRDILVAVPLEETDKVGILHMPANFKQVLRTHYKLLVLASGPEAKEVCPAGTVIHASESWGEKILHQKKTLLVGRARDINGICEGERIEDLKKYLD